MRQARTELWPEHDWLSMVINLRYQIAMARLYYWTRPGSLPNRYNVEAMARYWKQHYNTRFGKGTVEKAVKDYNDYVKEAA